MSRFVFYNRSISMKSIALLLTLLTTPLCAVVRLNFNIQTPDKSDTNHQLLLSEELPSRFNFSLDELVIGGAIFECDSECVAVELHVHSKDENGAITGVTIATVKVDWEDKAEVVINEYDENDSIIKTSLLSVKPTRYEL